MDHAAVLDLAEATGLTAYDASYLWLARSLDGELVTLDRKLAGALQKSERLGPAPVSSLSQISACQKAIRVFLQYQWRPVRDSNPCYQRESSARAFPPSRFLSRTIENCPRLCAVFSCRGTVRVW